MSLYGAALPALSQVLPISKKKFQEVKINLGEDYLEIIKQQLGSLKSEVIIAIENQQI